jgi:FtsP/CotA-like multicopper oxidase with cupredoxin domain
MSTKKLLSRFYTTGTRLVILAAMLMAAFISSVTPASAATVPFDLYAVSGTTTLGVQTVTVWGYNSTGIAATKPGGPVLIVNQGDTVQITLHNQLTTESTALLFQGQAMIPDTTGATANGGTKTYTFTATNPGTFLYEAGLLPNAEHQTAMGLYGALIVRPATADQAYDSATTAFNNEAVLVLSEVDPALNNSATPSTFDMRNYAPRYFLINGKSYPSTDPIASAAGNNVLLRYVNAGIQQHSMAVLGLRQNFVAKDGSLLPTLTHNVAAESLAPGQTGDAIITIPVATTTASKFAVYDGSLMLRNSNTAGFGGMLTFVTTGPTVIVPPIVPTTSGVALSPNTTNGSAAVILSASINSATSTITAAEYFIDATGANGTGIAMAGSFGSATVAVNATISIAQLSALASGNHTIYVHGTDGINWSAFASAVLKLDKAGPVSSGLTLTPNPSSGSVSVALSATGNDSATGGSNIAAAEYTIDGGAVPCILPSTSTCPMVASTTAAPVASITATIRSGLSAGSHTVAVRSQDALGNWGSPATITLNVVASPPVTSLVSASKNPNNGALPLNSSQPVVRVTATMTSTGSTVSAAEGFIDSNPATTVRGFPFVPSDGSFNSATETGYGDIPLTTINTLSAGNHDIYVRGKDALGNWGLMSTTILVIDRTAPTVSAANVTPAASNNASVIISATATDTACTPLPSICVVGGGEYYIDAAGVAGTGVAMTPAAALPTTTISASIPATTIAALTTGNHTIYVRAKDAAGNWSTSTANATLLIDRTAPTFSGITLTPNSIAAGTATVNLTVNGASDGAGGSGVAGGEWWFGSTNITAGTGTAFSGLTATINTSALTANTTVRVRIRDAAGNWSVSPSSGVRTATLTVTAPIPDAIFADGFESGNTNAWSSTSGTTSVTAGAALVGTRGLQVAGNGTNRVQYDFGTVANPATGTFDARFYFNPNGNAGTNQDIFVARTTGGTTVFRVRYRWNGGSPQVQIQVGTGTGNAAWTNITNNASNRIEVVWQSGSTLQLFVGGSLVANQSLVATATSVGQFRLGSVTSGGIATLEYFDAFSAKRSVTPYGP